MKARTRGKGAPQARLVREQAFVNRALREALPRGRGPAGGNGVVAAMREAVLGGGKRVRPLVALRVGELLGLRQEQVRGLCNCVELLHSASFVLDDLPSMDGAYERRGKPPLHLLFDEATAILAANALLVLAFEELVTRSPGVPQRVVMDLTVDAARTVGFAGMTGGQHEDLTKFEGRRASHRVFEAVQRKKTGVLFEFAARAAARMAGATRAQAAAIDRYAVNLGIAFQMTDDILAATKSARELGKGSRHDTGRALLQHNAAQLAWARRTADRHMVKADAALAIFGAGAQPLRDLSRMILSRG